MSTIGILTPSYGYARFINDALDSVSHQHLGADAASAQAIEHIVVDGASTDGTVALLERRAPDGTLDRPADDGSAHYRLCWTSQPDDGQSDALNTARSACTSDIIGWLNADEFYLPGAFDTVLRTFAATDADVVFGDCVFVDAEARGLRLVGKHPLDRFVLRNKGCYVQTCSWFVRAAALPQHPWDTGARMIMDWDLFLTQAEAGLRFVYVPEALGAFRVHGDRVTAVTPGADDPEFVRIRTRHGIPTGPPAQPLLAAAGRLRHIARKARGGAYRRELEWRRHRGSDLRWWI